MYKTRNQFVIIYYWRTQDYGYAGYAKPVPTTTMRTGRIPGWLELPLASRKFEVLSYVCWCWSPLALIIILATRWSYVHLLQIWPPGGATCISCKLAQLALVTTLYYSQYWVGIFISQSHISEVCTTSWTQLETPGPILTTSPAQWPRTDYSRLSKITWKLLLCWDAEQFNLYQNYWSPPFSNTIWPTVFPSLLYVS